MKRTACVLVGAAFALASCGPTVPDSGAGAGFQGYGDTNQYRAQRDAELVGQRPASASPPAASGTPTTIDPNTGEAPANVATTNNPNISDENDFSAVSNRQSIESDAERLRQQAAAYQVIEPTAVPNRSGASGPNIVQYAISTRNPVGQKIYRRSALGGQAKFQRNCAKYGSSDQAQEDFLKSGGPQKDRKRIDPDGDGYACFWDPTPFRKINSGNG